MHARSLSLFSMCVAAATVVTLAARTSIAGGQATNYVKRQATYPGAAESGHLNLTGHIKGAYFHGNGAQITNLNGSAIYTGLVADARLSSNIPRKNGTNIFSGTNQFDGQLNVYHESNFAARAFMTAVYFDSYLAMGRLNPVNSGEKFAIVDPNATGMLGMVIEAPSDGRPYYGYNNGSGLNMDTYHYLWKPGGHQRWDLVVGNTTRLVADDTGSVGIGSFGAGTLDGKLFVDGRIRSQSNGEPAIEGVNGLTTPHGVGNVGVYGAATGSGVGSGTRYGVLGYADGDTSYGVYGTAVANPGHYAGFFEGNSHTTGTLTAGTKSFLIDHPLDPANRYLEHSSVESNERMNIYRGHVNLDERGEAIVTMPSWFEALNEEFEYQLTCLGGYAPVYIGTELQDGKFTIAGGRPGLKVSWQITGVRHDPVARSRPLEVERTKPAAERGRYLNPEAYGLDASKGIGRPQK